MNKQPYKILFICIHNSARSQMAESFLNKYSRGKAFAVSAGIAPGIINPLVVELMKEEEIDISRKTVNSVTEVIRSGKKFDYVITVCDETSAANCPILPGTHKLIHWTFDDPSKLTGSAEDNLRELKIIRNQIKNRIKDWIIDTF
ncbi:arsenate reductase ArsC [Elusimicrobiota bacterium]